MDAPKFKLAARYRIVGVSAGTLSAGPMRVILDFAIGQPVACIPMQVGNRIGIYVQNVSTGTLIPTGNQPKKLTK